MSDEQEPAGADDPDEDAAAETEAAETGAADTEAAETGAADTEEGDGDGADGIQEGDVIRLSYTLQTADDGTVVDTTDPEVGEEADLQGERVYEPRTLVVGEHQVFEAVEQDLVGKEAGESDTVVVPMEEAFGEYDPDEVRTIGTDRLPEDSRFPGAQVEIDGEQGLVEAVYSGRSRVDFNHPLAGEDLEYDYEVIEVVEDRVEKARGLLQTYFDVDLDMHVQTDEVEEVVQPEPDEAGEDADAESEEAESEEEAEEAESEEEAEEAESEEEAEEAESEEEAEDEAPETELVEKETLYVESDPQLQFNQQWLFSKQQIARQIIDLIDVDRVVIQEVIEAQPAGMPGMMGGGAGLGDVEEALEDADVEAEDVVEELEADAEE